MTSAAAPAIGVQLRSVAPTISDPPVPPSSVVTVAVPAIGVQLHAVNPTVLPAPVSNAIAAPAIGVQLRTVTPTISAPVPPARSVDTVAVPATGVQLRTVLPAISAPVPPARSVDTVAVPAIGVHSATPIVTITPTPPDVNDISVPVMSLRVTTSGYAPGRDRVPSTALPVGMLMPPPAVSGGRQVLALPPMLVQVTAGGTVVDHVDEVDVPVMLITASMPLPRLEAVSLIRSAPADGDIVTTPVFIIALIAQDDTETFTVQVRYGAASDFSDAVLMQADVPAVLGGTTLIPQSYPQGVLYWQARLLQDGDPVIAWTDTRTFTVDSQIVSADLPVTWSVSGSADRPVHLWHFDPPGGQIGDTVTVYGQGFPTSGHLVLGDQLVDTSSWQLVSASSDDTDDSTRMIDAQTVTPEHYEIVFTVPDYDGPGAALSVEA